MPINRMLNHVTAIVLGGGRGTRLYPLTKYRSKPATPLAGQYRLVDVPISNCIHSGIRKIFVLTQYNSASLNRHIANTYKFDGFTEGWVEILAAQQTDENDAWYQGTADAVRQNLMHILDPNCSHVLILSGDALYRQDYSEVLEKHMAADAEITVCCKLVGDEQAGDFGITGITTDRRIVSFVEKPDAARRVGLEVQPTTIREAGLSCDSEKTTYLASMGIYLFNKDVLLEVLDDHKSEDFGKQVIPQAIASRRVYADLFDGYWEDIGTIRAFFDASLDLVRDCSTFSFYEAERPVFTHARYLPPSEIRESNIKRALIAEGCRICQSEISNSIVGIRSVIEEGSVLEDVVMMGADFYDSGDESPKIGVGKNCLIKGAIIDKNARIGDGCRITNETRQSEVDTEMFSVRDGVVIIPKNAILPPGTII